MVNLLLLFMFWTKYFERDADNVPEKKKEKKKDLPVRWISLPFSSPGSSSVKLKC